MTGTNAASRCENFIRLIVVSMSGRRLAALALVGLVAPLGACQVSIGNPTRPSPSTTSIDAQPSVPKSDLEQITGQEVREKSGGGTIVVACPGDLPIKMGATQVCTLDQDGKHFNITLTINKADSPNDASWGWEIGPPLSSS